MRGHHCPGSPSGEGFAADRPRLYDPGHELLHEGRPVRPEQVVVSVEHASHAVPAGLGSLGLAAAYLKTHHGWDPGAANVARILAASCGAPLHLGRWTRLLADLNRSENHRWVVPKTSGGRPVPANAELSRAERLERLERYWLPYRAAVEADLDRRVDGFGRALHISVHTFTPRLNGETRHCDIGLLYQPSRRGERAMADRWDRLLTGRGYRVRRNYPYSGLDDGFCMRMRAQRSPRSYLGMEIEMNQQALQDQASLRRMAQAFADALGRELRR
jgi:predicted N-formylglutamate amidohydrolase